MNSACEKLLPGQTELYVSVTNYLVAQMMFHSCFELLNLVFSLRN